MKSPLISGFRQTTTRIESPGARVAGSMLAAGAWESAGVTNMSAGNARRRHRCSGIDMILVGRLIMVRVSILRRRRTIHAP